MGNRKVRFQVVGEDRSSLLGRRTVGKVRLRKKGQNGGKNKLIENQI